MMSAKKVWTEQKIAEAIRDWTRENGKAPRAVDWRRAGMDHPGHCSVERAFGSWFVALGAAILLGES